MNYSRKKQNIYCKYKMIKIYINHAAFSPSAIFDLTDTWFPFSTYAFTKKPRLY